MRLLRDLVEMERRAALLAELGDELVVAGVDAQRDLKVYVAQRLRGGELRLQVPVGTAGPEAQGEHRQQHEDAESLECAGESNHGLCSTRICGRETFDRGPHEGFDHQRREYTPVALRPSRHPRARIRN